MLILLSHIIGCLWIFVGRTLAEPVIDSQTGPTCEEGTWENGWIICDGFSKKDAG